MAEETLPQLLQRNYECYGDKKVGMRKMDFGIWQRYTWKDYYENVKYFCLGLMSLGFERGDKIAILGENDPEWYWGEIAAQAAGGAAAEARESGDDRTPRNNQGLQAGRERTSRSPGNRPFHRTG